MPPLGEDTLSQLPNVGQVAVVRQADPERVVGVHGLGLLLKASKKSRRERKDGRQFHIFSRENEVEKIRRSFHTLFVKNKVDDVKRPFHFFFLQNKRAIS